MSHGMTARSSNGTPRVSAETLARLEALLNALTSEYAGLSAELDEYRAALAQADRGRLAEALGRQQARVNRLGELESHRLALMRALVPGAANQPAATLTTSQILAHAPEPARSRLAGLADRLRPVIEKAEEQQRVARLATQSLLAHATGIMQQIQRQLTGTGTYTAHARGPVAAAAPVVSALDLTT